MYQFTASSCPPATISPPPVPLVIDPELVADRTLSWLERALIARIATRGPTTTADLAHYLGREPGTVRNLIAALIRRGYLCCTFEPDPQAPWRSVRVLMIAERLAENSARPTETRPSLPSPPAENSAPPLKNQRDEPAITLEIQASGDPWRTVPASESLSLRERNAKSSSSQVPDTESVLGTQSPLDEKATERGTPAVLPRKVSEGREPQERSGPPFDLPEPSPGASRLLGAGVDWPMAARLAELRPMAQVEGAIARQKREGKGIGWLVMCLRDGWAVDTPPAPRAPQSDPRGDSAAVIATRAYLADKRHSVPAEPPEAELAAFRALRDQLGRSLAREQAEAEQAMTPPAARQRVAA